MTNLTPQTTNRFPRRSRWLLLLGVVAVAALLVVLLSTLLRRLGPTSEVWLRIAPAASTLADAESITLSSGGWQRNEQIAICLNQPGESACNADIALSVESADTGGNLVVSLNAAAALAEGRTTFLVHGLETGRQASRSFRVLRASDGAAGVAGVTSSPAAGEPARLTPIAGAPPADQLPPAAGTATAEYFANPDQGGQFPDWRGEYFTNPDLAGQPALVRNDPDPNLDWGEDSPAPGIIPADGFSVRWTRSLDFAPGTYRFVLTAEDGGRLLIEGQTVIDAWQGAAGKAMIADQPLLGGRYLVSVQFRDLSGPARLAIGWSPLPTPAPVAAVDATPTPSLPPTPAPTPQPVAPATATPTVDLSGSPTFTPVSGATTPGATETAMPTSSVTASPTETGATPNSVTATPTATPTPTSTGTPLTPPGSIERLIEINPSVGRPGQVINITSGNWSPGTVLRVALGEFGKPYSQAVELPGVTFTTPSDSSQSFSFTFVFPNEPPWSTQLLPVQVWVHNSGWTEWGRDYFDIDQP